MTHQPPYTITTHWHPGKHTALDEPTTDTAPDWPTARTKALKLTTLRNTAAVTVRDADGELIANWDIYSNLWREPRPAKPFVDPLVDVARARLLAADYRANPTPARAHNAAQVLGEVLQALDAVLAQRAQEAPRVAAAELLCQLFGGQGVNRDRLGKALTQAWIDWHRLSDTLSDWPTLQPTIDALAARRDQARAESLARMADQLDMPPLAELPDGAANHWTAVADAQTQLADLVAKHMRPITEPLCHAPTSGLNCIYPLNHAGDHSDIMLPPGYPIVIPADQLPPAAGGIVDPNRTARLTEAQRAANLATARAARASDPDSIRDDGTPRT